MSGKAGDFDFLAGEWVIQHCWRSSPDDSEWLTFAGEATCWTILAGIGSVEELRIPARDFSGMGLRLLDIERGIWSDFWVNARSGVLTAPGAEGVFIDGTGTFESADQDGDQTILARGIWDNITPTSCRWRQAVSRDGGATWEETWVMEWARATANR
jgi:hypothetical protein